MGERKQHQPSMSIDEQVVSLYLFNVIKVEVSKNWKELLQQ